ncbi:MAG: tetratricopeptide repeat protein, partial [Acidobacteria bacterium]|nr:tetratricopeptide repeat protein [Acidobacteriota bacterium]
ILHRDLKPSNLLVSEHDGRPVPKIIDFGIAKALDRPLIERTLAVGLDLLGTPSYMSPEAMESGEKVDTRSDVYGLGVVLYELIVGARPLERRTGESVLSLVRRISVEEPPQPIRRWRALAPEDREGIAAARQRSVAGMERLLESDLGIVIMKALARDPERRYGSVRELEADLGRFLDDQPIQARPPTAGYLLKKLMVRHRGAVVAVTVAALALVLGSIGTTLGFLRAKEAQRKAVAEARAAVEAREQTDEINEFLTGIFQASAVNSQGADRPPQEITALELLESGADRVETELEEQPAVAARMLMTLGEVYRQLGLYDRALELLEAAGERAEKGEAPASLRASIPREKAQILLRLGRYPESRAELDRALELGERIEDEEERKAFLSTAFDHSGRLARKAGDFEKAERDQKEAVRLRWEAREISWTDLISSEANLGIVYFDQGQWREAEAQFRKTLELCREHLPPGHTTTGHLLNNLAAALGNQSRNDDARPLLEESLAIQRRMLGDEHPAIASILNNLGFMSYDLRDLEAAERFHREALEIRRKTLGGEHPATAWSVDNLSRVRADLGDLDEALDLQTEALRIRQLSLGAGHPEIARSHEYLAELARRQNRDLDALEELEQAIEVRTASLGEDDPSLVPTLIDRAEVLTDLGRSDEARTELDRALTLAPEATTDPQAQKDRQHALQLLAKLDGGDR